MFCNKVYLQLRVQERVTYIHLSKMPDDFEEMLRKAKSRPMALEGLLGLLGDEIQCLLTLHRLYLASDSVELQRHGRDAEGIPDDLLNACRY